MDNVLNLKDYKKVNNVSDDTYGEFIRQVKNKYDNRVPPLMINTIENFNNKGITVQAGGPSENEVWFVYLVKDRILYIKPGKISLTKI